MQIAEPWKPLPPPEEEEKKKGSAGASAGSAQRRAEGWVKQSMVQGLAILPGVPGGEEKSPKERLEEGADSDSDSNEGTAGDEYELLEVWKSSAKAMRLGSASEDDYDEPASHGWILKLCCIGA
eukprot:Skav205899  [mRNA]  locus=scaffold123:250782:253470:+ [translate_table: standard]